MTETEWWACLAGDDIRVNTEGDPPYDAETVAERIADRLGHGGRVLDVGCGTGRLTAAYEQVSGSTVVGFDPSPQILTQAAARLPDTEFTTKMPDGPFTGAYSVTVFQHLPATECAQLVHDVTDRLSTGSRFCFQYVEGDEDTFLSHQTDVDTVLGWCRGLTLRAFEQDPGYPQWHWVTVQR